MTAAPISRPLLLCLLAPAIALTAWSAWRARAAERAAVERARAEDAAWDAVNGSPTRVPTAATGPNTPSGAGARLRLEIALAMPPNAASPTVALRLRARDGAERPFDVTASDPRPRVRYSWPIELPVAAPELPLRVDLVGDDWCLGPGLDSTVIHRLDEPFKLQLHRAVRHERLFQQEGTLKPLPDVEVRHEGGALLGRSDAAGRATYLRPARDPAARGGAENDELLALAVDHAPAWIEPQAGSAVLLRPLSRGGTVAVRVVGPDGAPIAGARVLPRHQVGEEGPTDPAARALFGALWFSRERPLVALAATTDADGRCGLPWPWPCAVRLRVDHRDHGQIVTELGHAAHESDAGRVTTLELRFPRRVQCVIAASQAGAPAATLSVEVMTREFGGERGVAAGITGVDGRVTLSVPALSPLWIVARGRGRAATVQELPLSGDTASQRREIEIPLAESRAVSGAISAAARGIDERNAAPVPGIVHVLQVSDAASELLLEEVTVPPDGRFRIERVPVGRSFAIDLVTPGGVPQRLHVGELSHPPDDGAAGSSTTVELGELGRPPAGG
jgi:hypothetical protein